MAIFHLSAKVISRGKGQSAVAASAYRSGRALVDAQTGEVKHYVARQERIVFEGVFAPKNAPAWARDRGQLWNNVEAFENRKNSQLAREIEIAIPHELTKQQREWLVKDFVREQFTRQGFAVDVAIHAPEAKGKGDGRNFHCHLMVTMRRIEGQEFESHKDRSLNSKEQLSEWREAWAKLANKHLERHGFAERIDHRSHAERGIEQEPTIHLGYAACALLNRGQESERVARLAEILARNDSIEIPAAAVTPARVARSADPAPAPQPATKANAKDRGSASRERV